jgi:hypothetical protein
MPFVLIPDTCPLIPGFNLPFTMRCGLAGFRHIVTTLEFDT